MLGEGVDVDKREVEVMGVLLCDTVPLLEEEEVEFMTGNDMFKVLEFMLGEEVDIVKLVNKPTLMVLFNTAAVMFALIEVEVVLSG